MHRIPNISIGHKICVICEGFEDIEYFKRLLELNVWDKQYVFSLINAKSASNIVPRFEDAYHKDSYELILIFCDTDKYPYREYNLIKQKINEFLGGDSLSQKIIIFANPCTMQIILSHFGDVLLKNQGKKTNSSIIEEFTGVENYNAHEEQIKKICGLIFRRTYFDMKSRVAKLNLGDEASSSTNFIEFLDKFESEDSSWINEINESLEGNC